jgi:hypothetical protein
MAAAGTDRLTAPTAEEERFCPYHGGWILLADCPIVATNDEFNASAGAGTPHGAAERTTAKQSDVEDLLAHFGVAGNEEKPDAAPEADQAAPGRTKRRMAAEVIHAGSLVKSRVDGEDRVVLALGPGYVKRRMKRPETLKSPAEMALRSGGPTARPARACPFCRHPLPATIDYRNAYPIALVGHSEASKTSTVVALIEEAGRRDPADFGVDRLMPTEATTLYLQKLDNEIFVKFRQGRRLARTQGEHHPPLEFITTLPTTGASISLLLHDVAGEDLMRPNMRLKRAPSVLWADAILFLYNPEHSPALDTSGQQGQATILNGIRDDLESRGPVDASGRPYEEPPLLLVVSKADLLPRQYPIAGRRYRDQDVQQALRELGDGAVVNAANRFPDVHWLFMAPMPNGGGGPVGVVELFQLLLSQLV